MRLRISPTNSELRVFDNAGLLRFERDGFLSGRLQNHKSRSGSAPLSASPDEGDNSTENKLVTSMANAVVSSVYPTNKLNVLVSPARYCVHS